MKRIGIWLRVSTEDQVKGESPEHHEERARAYALAKGWSVVEVYRLDAVSGKSVKEHTEARRMLDHIRRGHIDGLVFSKLARLARNTRELLEFAEEFQRYGADLISLQESIDTSTAAGRLFYTVIAAVGQWEREETSERVAASVPVRARLGKSVGGQAVYGYQWMDGRLEPHPDEAPVRRLIYELYREHKRQQTVARILNERGYRTRNGDSFTTTSIGRLITDPTAKGVRVANRCKSHGKGQRWTLKPESEWVKVPVEPIVSEDLWEECNAIFNETGLRYRTHRGRKPVYLFAGVLHCGVCNDGKKLYRQKGWDKYRCFRCNNKIAEDDLEAIFLEQLSGFLLSKESVDQLLEESRMEIARRQRLGEGLRKDRTKLTKSADALVKLYQEGGIDVQEFKDRHLPIRERLATIEVELARIEKEAGVIAADESAKRSALEDGARLKDEWPRMSFDQKRRIVEALIERVRVAGDEVEFDLSYLPGTLIDNCDQSRSASESQPSGPALSASAS